MFDFEEVSQEQIEMLCVENKKSRLFCGILYEEDLSHKFAIECLRNNTFRSIAIIHDRDVNSLGESKKTHIHFIIRFENAKFLEKVAKDLRIKPNYLQCCNSFNGYSKYIIHIDEPFKAQYLPEEVFGSLFNDFLSAIQTVDNENIKVLKIINYIYDNQIMTIKNLATWCCQNGLYDTFRRNYSMFRDIKNEKDGKL